MLPFREGTRRLGEKEACGFETQQAVGDGLERVLRAALARPSLHPEDHYCKGVLFVGTRCSSLQGVQSRFSGYSKSRVLRAGYKLRLLDSKCHCSRSRGLRGFAGRHPDVEPPHGMRNRQRLLLQLTAATKTMVDGARRSDRSPMTYIQMCSFRFVLSPRERGRGIYESHRSLAAVPRNHRRGMLTALGSCRLPVREKGQC